MRSNCGNWDEKAAIINGYPEVSEDLALMSATNLVELYRERQLSPVEVTRATLDNISTQNSIGI